MVPSLRSGTLLLPRAASTARSAILRRRNTASSSRTRPGYHPRPKAEPRKRSLEVCASRELSSRRSPALIPHTCAVSPTFRYGAFFFVAFALAALSSARLATHERSHTSMQGHNFYFISKPGKRSCRRISPLRRRVDTLTCPPASISSASPLTTPHRNGGECACMKGVLHSQELLRRNF